MDQNVPDWINKTFVTKVLETNKPMRPVKVISFTAEPAVAPGNNYLSKIYRVKVDYEDEGGILPEKKSVSLMVKAPLESGFLSELPNTDNFYDREPKVYSELLPNLNKKVRCEIGPKFFHSPVKNVLVTKDLKADGYIICDKYKQLDYFHCKMVLENLAKFHASTVAYSHENPGLFEDVGKELFWIEESAIEPMVKLSLEQIIKTIDKMEGCEKMTEFLVKGIHKIWIAGADVTKPKPAGGFNVLNHGDLWTNNILFKYNRSGEVIDVKFIDFQITRFSSPVNDLIYFMWTSANDDVRGKRQKTLFHIYLNTLNKTLESIGCVERLSIEELEEDLKRAADFALITIAHLLPYMMADSEGAIDLTHMSKDNFQSEEFTKIFKGKAFNDLVPRSIKDFIKFFLNGRAVLL